MKDIVVMTITAFTASIVFAKISKLKSGQGA